MLALKTFGQVGINTTTPDPSAALDITSTTGGLLLPRMTNAERQAISNPAEGLMVYVTDFDGGTFLFYDGTGWKELSLTDARDTPDAPTIGTVNAGDGQATVSFTAPSNDGGSIITSYTATSNPGGITGTVTQSGSGSITVTGLTNDTAYTFTVTATNAIGTSAASVASNSVTPVPVPTVGDFYQGGVIFYLFQPGDAGYVEGETHGLIAAVEDQSSAIQWHNGSHETTGATSTAIGTGSANTDAIIAVQGATETSYAAGLARAYDGGGYTDWFLPSKDELNEMYQNKATIDAIAASNGGSSFDPDYYYWSSTEGGYNYSWRQGFEIGDQGGSVKYSTHYVRAVRAF